MVIHLHMSPYIIQQVHFTFSTNQDNRYIFLLKLINETSHILDSPDRV